MGALRIASFQDLASLINLGLTVAGIALVILQLGKIKASLVASSHASIYERAADFRAHLLKYPELRPFFFDGAAVPETYADRARLTTLAEIYVNYLEHIFLTYDGLGDENRRSLDRFLRGAMLASPFVRNLIEHDSFRVSGRFRSHVCSLDGACPPDLATAA